MQGLRSLPAPASEAAHATWISKGWRQACREQPGTQPLHSSVLLGLCGNYNGDTTDDFLSSMNIIEGTASLFVDSWRLGNCPSALEREMDPCSMSQLNSECSSEA